MVNRGWLPWDLKDTRMDSETDITKISGVLYRGDTKTRENKKNVPVMQSFWFTYPEELSVLLNMKNEEEAS